MNVMRYMKAIVAVTFVLLNFGCDNWLDVKPIDRVSEEQLYSTEPGFKQALNGVYVELNHADLYGGELLFNALEVLAQRYQFSSVSNETKLYNLANFNYTTDYSKEVGERIWQKAYALIANVNKILLNAELRKDIFSRENYEWITGEAYALRAFLHFDLLRLFGPVYATHKTDKAICYNTEFSLSAADMLTCEEVAALVISDLKEAEKRLVNDPVIEQGPMMSDAGTDDENYWRYRSMRLNYYAVKALQARVYLYAGMPEEACKAARIVTGVQEKWYPFVKYTNIVGNAKDPDRVFSTELLFAMQNSQRDNIFTTNFSPELTSSNILKTPDKYQKYVFGSLADKDWRYSSTWLTNSKQEFRCFYKYAKVDTKELYNYMLPLIRMSEMYYILAEASTDATEALNSINLVLENRGLDKLTSGDKVKETLLGEYQKEFWGEGQLFFYYKRLNTPSVYSAMNNAEVAMDDVKYRMPLPESEMDFR